MVEEGIEVSKVKQFIKEFIEWLVIDTNKLIQLKPFEFEQKAKEIFGERLI